MAQRTARMESRAWRLQNSYLRFRKRGARFDTKLESVKQLNSLLRPSVAYIVCSHQFLFEQLVSLPNALAIIHIKSSQRLNLFVQMSNQLVRECLDETPNVHSIIVIGSTSLSILLKPIKSGCESSVLLDVLFHDALNTCDLLDAREEHCFFGIVVVVHGFTPALAICQKVLNHS